MNTEKKADIKILKFSPTIAKNDLNTKIKQMEKLLLKKKYIKCIVFFPGRNILFPENGDVIFDKILSSIKNGKLVNRTPLKGSTMEMFISPIMDRNNERNNIDTK